MLKDSDWAMSSSRAAALFFAPDAVVCVTRKDISESIGKEINGDFVGEEEAGGKRGKPQSLPRRLSLTCGR
ncbi:MAG: hypothetical protein JWP63_185 [Candidatus Solibacter sp.]|nr:hypothetical protein [Candidatus Solibacter sp.]